ncbi:TatD family hydrolase [Pyrofollis japonicus]|uniref:TatD family hydrolase n=1 Tax=Pyrofollis japonicus TaxID=3060460 RepID=UPI00295B08A5|nr:TatD family hydrolase [Pyrofollis japonicus]BEP17627.1 TatD family hydrolase [Pyrofollis japonicus]
MGSRLIDMHAHLHEFSEEQLKSILSGLGEEAILVGVSDDLESSYRTIELARQYSMIIPCIGLHPWSIKNEKEAIDEAKRIVELALDKGIRCIGEVGLDTKFVGETIEKQRKVFAIFLEAAREHNLVLNLHTAGTWSEVFDLLVKYDIKYANFHWYTGPLALLGQIEQHGYTISINPAIKIQKKHREVVKKASISIMLTESDSPYEYRGMKLTPLMIIDVLKEIALIKNMDFVEVKNQVWNNFREKYHVLLTAKLSM